jgi:hypothetical protein
MNTLNMNEMQEMERLTGLVSEAAAELEMDPEFVETVFGGWVSDGGSIIMQMAACAEFGCALPVWMNANPYITDTADAQALLRWLRNRESIETVTVYRGTGNEGAPLESWTTEREIAEFYAQRNGGAVVERTVTRNDVLCTWRNGLGLECAREVIIINR